MRERIIARLRQLEKDEDIRIIHAVESGSRAWGFASPDSDYDVRFIYIRQREFYLRLNKTRDVIEPPIDLLDINGWDFDKTLRLLHSSNPTLFEWANSPIVYLTCDFFSQIKSTMHDYFNQKACLNHYFHMALGNYRTHLKGEMVRAKKYLYVIRPLLACKWILQNNCPPPIPFSELVQSQLDAEIKPAIDNLLELKANLPEMGEMPKIELLNTYIDDSFLDIKAKIEALPKPSPADWDRLNKLFLSAFERAKL